MYMLLSHMYMSIALFMPSLSVAVENISPVSVPAAKHQKHMNRNIFYIIGVIVVIVVVLKVLGLF